MPSFSWDEKGAYFSPNPPLKRIGKIDLSFCEANNTSSDKLAPVTQATKNLTHLMRPATCLGCQANSPIPGTVGAALCIQIPVQENLNLHATLRLAEKTSGGRGML